MEGTVGATSGSEVNDGSSLTTQATGGSDNGSFVSNGISNVQMEIEIPPPTSNEQPGPSSTTQLIPPPPRNVGYHSAQPNFYYPPGGIPATSPVGNREMMFYSYNNQYNDYVEPSAVVPAPTATVPYHNVYSNMLAQPACKIPGNNGEYIYFVPYGYIPSYDTNVGSQQPVARAQLVRQGRNDPGGAVGRGSVMQSVGKRSYAYSGFQQFMPSNAVSVAANPGGSSNQQGPNQSTNNEPTNGNQMIAQTSWTKYSDPNQNPAYFSVNSNTSPAPTSNITIAKVTSSEQNSNLVQSEAPVPLPPPAIVPKKKGPSRRKSTHVVLSMAETGSNSNVSEEQEPVTSSQKKNKKKYRKKTAKEDATTTKDGREPLSTETQQVFQEVIQRVNAKFALENNISQESSQAQPSSTFKDNSTLAFSIPMAVIPKQGPHAAVISFPLQSVAPSEKILQQPHTEAIPTRPEDEVSSSENEEEEDNRVRKCVVCLRRQRFTEDIYEEVGNAKDGQLPPLLKTMNALIGYLRSNPNFSINGKPSEEGICTSCFDYLQKWHVFNCSVQKLHSSREKSRAAFPTVPFPHSSFQVKMYRHPRKIAEMKEVLSGATHAHFTRRRLTDKDWDYFCDAIISEERGIDSLEKFIMSRDKLSHFYCAPCERLVNNGRKGFIKHMRALHSDELVTFPCDICGDRLLEKGGKCVGSEDYFSHWIKHFYLSLCDECGERFPTESKLAEHRSTMHPSSEIGGDGLSGTKETSVSIANDEPQMPVDKNRPFNCNLCHAKFKQRHQLKVHHESVHLNLLKYVCQVCGKGYKSWGSLRRHRLQSQHEMDSSFKCEICNRDFRTKLGLVTHSKTHINGPDNGVFTCEVCNKEFTTKSALTSHSKSHTEDVVFKCETCGKTYKTRRPFETHVCQDLMQCSTCGFETRVKTEFLKHKSIHKKKTNSKRTDDESEVSRPITRSKAASVSASSQGMVVEVDTKAVEETTTKDNNDERQPEPVKNIKKRRTTSESSTEKPTRKKKVVVVAAEEEVVSNPTASTASTPQRSYSPVSSPSSAKTDVIDPDSLGNLSSPMQCSPGPDSVNVTFEMDPDFAQPELVSTLRDRLLDAISNADTTTPKGSFVDEDCIPSIA